MGGALLAAGCKRSVEKQFVCRSQSGPALTALGVDIVPQPAPIFRDIVVLAIKPQMAAQVIPDVTATLPETCLFLSLMAGTSIVTLRDLLLSIISSNHAEHTGSAGAVFRRWLCKKNAPIYAMPPNG